MKRRSPHARRVALKYAQRSIAGTCARCDSSPAKGSTLCEKHRDASRAASLKYWRGKAVAHVLGQPLTKPQAAALRAMAVAPAPIRAFAGEPEHEVAGSTMSVLQPLGLATRVRIEGRWYGELTEAGMAACRALLTHPTDERRAR